MGRVFSPEQVRVGSNAVPYSSDFSQAITNFEQSANQEIEAGKISGAVIYGSVAIRAYTIRSDFDCLIVPFDYTPSSRQAISRIVAASNPSGRMEISPIVHTRARLESGAHEIDRYFGSHLTGESRLVFGEDPANYIKFPDYDARTTLLSYVRHKKRSVATVFTAEGPDYYKSLQRILELPLAVGRKALLATDEVEGTHHATADSANKARVVPASIKLFAALGIADTPRQILAINHEYSDVLNQRLNGEIKEHEYIDFLQEIEDCGEAASTWLDELDAALSAKIIS